MSKPQIILLTKDGRVSQVVIHEAPAEQAIRDAIEELRDTVSRGVTPEVIAFSDDFDVEVR